jgi:hypothetical protein
MLTALGQIPRSRRIATARRNAEAWRSRAAAEVAPHRRAICLRRAERMDAIADGGFIDRQVLDPQVLVNLRVIDNASKRLETAADEVEAVSTHYVTVGRDRTWESADERQEKLLLSSAIGEAKAYKKRRRQRDSFEKSMRKQGYEPIGDPTDQSPENWRRV